jgi:hypothetical protein
VIYDLSKIEKRSSNFYEFWSDKLHCGRKNEKDKNYKKKKNFDV